MKKIFIWLFFGIWMYLFHIVRDIFVFVGTKIIKAIQYCIGFIQTVLLVWVYFLAAMLQKCSKAILLWVLFGIAVALLLLLYAW